MDTQLDFDTANFLEFTLSRGNKITEVVENPDDFAKKMGLKLTEEQRSKIRYLGSPFVKDRMARLSKDAQTFIGHVIKDGRYLMDWKSNPEGVASRLKQPLEPRVAKEIRQLDFSDIIKSDGPHPMWIAVISVAVAVIVTAAALEGEEMPVVDFSRIEKL